MLRTALLAALAYAGLAFAAGFLFGTVRVLVLAPRLGGALAVLIEAPVMLAISWAACAFCVRAFRIEPGRSALAMGASAFVLLQGAEFALAVVMGRPPARYLAEFVSLPGAMGLAAQIAFALFPAIQRRRA